MGRPLVAFAYVRHSYRVDAGQPGSPDTRQPEVGTEHYENSLRGESHVGAGADQGARSPRDGDDCTSRNGRTAEGNQGLRVGPVDAGTSFIYISKCTKPRHTAYGMRKQRPSLRKSG